MHGTINIKNGISALAMLSVLKVMNANIINFKSGVTDKSAKRKGGKIGFICK